MANKNVAAEATALLPEGWKVETKGGHLLLYHAGEWQGQFRSIEHLRKFIATVAVKEG